MGLFDDVGSAFGLSGGGTSLVGTGAALVGGLYQNHSAHMEAEWARDWAGAMSNTAHRREVADLQAAGLNPVLSAGGGNGASTPSTSQPPVSDPVTNSINSALAIRANRADVNLKESSADLVKQQTETQKEVTAGQVLENSVKTLMLGKIPEEISNLIASRYKTDAERRRVEGEIRNALQEYLLLQGNVRLQGNQIPGSDTERQIDESDAGKIGRILKRITDIFGKPSQSSGGGITINNGQKKGK